MRKGPLILLAILFAGITVLVFSLSKGSRSLFTNPYRVIPPDAFLMVESSDLPELLNNIINNNGLFRELSSVKEVELTANKFISFRDYLNREEIRSLFEDNLSVVSLHQNVQGRVYPLMTVSIPSSLRYHQLSDILKSVSGGKLIESKAGNLRKTDIPFRFSGNSDTLHLAFVTGMILCSTSTDLLEEAISMKDNDTDIRSAPGLSRIMDASGTNEDKVFIIFRNITRVIDRIAGKKAPGLITGLANLAGSAEGDIYINESGFTFSGYTESNDSANFLFKYKSATPDQLVTYKVLPSATVMFETRLIPAVPSNSGGTDTDTVHSTMSFAQKIRPYIDSEITTVLIDSKENRPENNFLVIYKLANREMVEHILTEALEALNMQEGKEPQDYIRFFQPDDITRIPVYSTPFNNLAAGFFKNSGPIKYDSLFAFFDEFMITGNSFQTISRFLYDNLLNNTYANDLAYRDFENRLPSRAGYFFYCIPSGIINFLSGYFNDEIIDILNRNIGSIRKIQALGYQFASSNDMLYNTLTIKYEEKVREVAGTYWATLLDTAACIKPFLFTNHNTGAREIFIQDFRNNIYLVNAAGRILWKIRLNERIMSDVNMIDFYGNSKYQILFSGKNYLHLIDRNGNYVERYPVRLRSPASGPMALFDYDSNGDYRIAVAGEDKIIYVYDKWGNAVRGWKQFRTNSLVRTGIRFFRVSGKDYLVAADENSVYFLDRTGNIRLRLKEPVTKAINSEMRLNAGSDQYLVFTAPDGTVQYVSFDGNVRKALIRNFSGNHSFDYFDIDSDGFGEYIFIDNGKLYLYDHDKSEMFTRDFGAEELGGPIIFTFSASDKKIGVYNNKEKQIYLIDRNGNTVNGFPLRGASMFSIGKLSDKDGFQLIVGSSDNFLYNYRLNFDK